MFDNDNQEKESLNDDSSITPSDSVDTSLPEDQSADDSTNSFSTPAKTEQPITAHNIDAIPESPSTVSTTSMNSEVTETLSTSTESTSPINTSPVGGTTPISNQSPTTPSTNTPPITEAKPVSNPTVNPTPPPTNNGTPYSAPNQGYYPPQPPSYPVQQPSYTPPQPPNYYPPQNGYSPYGQPQAPRYYQPQPYSYPPQQPPVPPISNNSWDSDDFEPYQEKDSTDKKSSSKGIIIFVVVVIVLLVGAIITAILLNQSAEADSSTSISASNDPTSNGTEASVPPLNVGTAPDPSAAEPPVAGELLTVPQVAQKVTPSVVGIMRYDGGNRMEPTGIGSGIIMSVTEDNNVYIITNAHVVDGGSDFKIRISNGAEYSAELIGADVQSDIAVLMMRNVEGMVAAELGDSDLLQVGETVVAIGNPISFELSGSVTRGIVSALNREIEMDTGTMIYIQTDAAINPGNSGGALANEYGQVIGINTLKVQAEGYEGIGFAIPINEAIPIFEDIVTNGRVTSRPMLGVTGQMYSDGQVSGVLVVDVSVNANCSPTLEPYDIITAINGTPVTSLADIRAILNQSNIGDVVELEIYRMEDTVNSTTFTCQCTLIGSSE